MGQHVFIAYKHEDNIFANQLIYKIQQARFRVWIDEEQLRAGDNWREAINTAIRQSFAVILVLTPEARLSEFVTYEWAFALGAGVKVIPVLLRPVPQMHPQLDQLQYLDFTDQLHQPWERLVERIREIKGTYKTDNISMVSDAPRSVIQAVDALDSPNADTRRSALRSLAQMNHPAAYSALIDAVEHPLRDVRVDAGFMLAKQTNNSDFAAVPGLIEALSDEDARIRSAAVQTLGDIADPSAVPHLLQIVNHERDGNIRWQATGALTKMGQAAVPGLVQALSDEDWKVRRSACEALWAMAEPSAVPGLIKALTDPNDVVRQAASGALETMGAIAVPGLVEALHSAHRYTAPYLTAVLERINTTEALEAVRSYAHK
jgi:vesicle coat complex subunit